jgi:hypothetical protein
MQELEKEKEKILKKYESDLAVLVDLLKLLKIEKEIINQKKRKSYAN